NMGCEAIKFFPAEANGGVDKLKNIGAALKTAKWMCTGGVNAKNVNTYLAYPQIIAVGGTWMCKADKIKAGAWDEITAMSKEAVDVMLGLELGHIGINCADDAEAAKTAETLAGLLSMAVKPGNSSIFVGKKEFEIMKKPGRGTHGHIAIKCNNVDRAVYHLSRRGVKFDLDSMVNKDGKNIAIYLADEVAGFAIHLVQK
ncbi:MAG: keto-hydroxyglutarate-aldolase/keto-deoxy-phosphogluconate aldolase, partial [Gemmiger sp.]